MVRRVSLLFVILLFSLWVTPLLAQTSDYKNSRINVDTRVKDLLGRMTLEEKIAQIRHLHYTQVFESQMLDTSKLERESRQMSWGFIEGFPLTGVSCHQNYQELQKYMMERTRLGIPAFIVGEALHGAVHEGATIFPQNVALGSTFNPDLAYKKAAIISEELHYLGVNQILAPCIDVIRELRWGRVEESFGEDPFLCGVMGLNEVNGYLDNHISPMLKHFGPHGNPRGGLNLASVDGGASDLYDIYLKPFEMIVRDTKINAIMSSYNSWNRTPNSASKLMLTDILRKKWGFEGYVYSDWGAIRLLKEFHFTACNDYEAAYQAFTSGLDVEASSTCYPSLVQLYQNRKITMEQIDRSVSKVLKAKFDRGLFDDPWGEKRSFISSFHSQKAIGISKEIADESVVLLKNEGDVLPLDRTKFGGIAVIGPNADEVQFGDYSWSGNKADGITPLEAIRRYCGDKTKVNYSRGCEIASLDQSSIAEAVSTVEKSDVALVFVGGTSCTFVRQSQSSPISGEGFDLTDLSLTGAQQKLVEAVYATGKPTIVILVTGKPFAIPWIKEHIPGILVQWYGGEQEGSSITDILFGRVNPSGKLPLSFPQSTGHLPVFYNYLPSDKGFYNEHGSYAKPGKDYVFSSPNALWSFGYGLSYTKFSFGKVVADKNLYAQTDTIHLTTSLKNVGNSEGKEVIQVYIRDCYSSVVTPVKQLRAFSKILLQPDEKKIVSFSIPATELYLSTEDGNKYSEDGIFEIQVGNASNQIYQSIYIGIGDEECCKRQLSEIKLRNKQK